MFTPSARAAVTAVKSKTLNDATGGQIWRVGDYQYNVFVSSGNFRFTKKGSISEEVVVLLVKGGQGGGSADSVSGPEACGTGGGQGGSDQSTQSVWKSPSLTFTVNSFTLNADYAVTVGAGGGVSSNGTHSSVTIGGTLYDSNGLLSAGAYGGGGGGGCNSDNGSNGNNGGAGPQVTGFTDVEIPAGIAAEYFAGGGGGGGGGGGDSSNVSSAGGNGGSGGGGGGGGGGAYFGGVGANNGGDGTANTGGGGGGGGGAHGLPVGGSSLGGDGGAGGSGVAIFKFKYK